MDQQARNKDAKQESCHWRQRLERNTLISIALFTPSDINRFAARDATGKWVL